MVGDGFMFFRAEDQSERGILVGQSPVFTSLVQIQIQLSRIVVGEFSDLQINMDREEADIVRPRQRKPLRPSQTRRFDAYLEEMLPREDAARLNGWINSSASRRRRAAEIQGKVFQRTLVAGFIPMNHVWSGKRDYLYCNCQIRAVFSRLEIEGRKSNGEAQTVDFDGFTGNDPRVRNNVQVAGFSTKFWIPLGAAAEYVFATDTEIGLLVNQGIVGRSTPPSACDWICEFRENPFERRGVRVFKLDRCMLQLIVHLSSCC